MGRRTPFRGVNQLCLSGPERPRTRVPEVQLETQIKPEVDDGGITKNARGTKRIYTNWRQAMSTTIAKLSSFVTIDSAEGFRSNYLCPVSCILLHPRTLLGCWAFLTRYSLIYYCQSSNLLMSCNSDGYCVQFANNSRRLTLYL